MSLWRFLLDFVNVRKLLTTIVNFLHHLADAWGGESRYRTKSVQMSV